MHERWCSAKWVPLNEWQLNLLKVSFQTHSVREFKAIVLRASAPENDYLLYINYHPVSYKKLRRRSRQSRAADREFE